MFTSAKNMNICKNPPVAALRYIMYFQLLYEWRHVWLHWAIWQCVEGWTFNLLPLAALRYRGGVWCLWMPCFVMLTVSLSAMLWLRRFGAELVLVQCKSHWQRLLHL